MKTSIELRSIAERTKSVEAVDFWYNFKDRFAILLEAEANKGKFELSINPRDKGDYKWLSEPNLYKIVISELESLGFKVSHNDDYRDGTYMIINW